MQLADMTINQLRELAATQFAAAKKHRASAAELDRLATETLAAFMDKVCVPASESSKS